MPKKGSAKKASKPKSAKTKAAAKRVSAKKTIEVKQPPVHPPPPGILAISREVFGILKTHIKVLLGIVAVYLVLNVLFASGLSSLGTAVESIKNDFNNQEGQSQTLAKAISGFGTLVGSGGTSGSSSASVLQSILFIIESLVIIWALRQLLSGKKIGVKEAYYNSMYPLIPFIIVLVVIILQLLPLSVGTVIVNAVLTSAVSSLTLATWLSWFFFIGLASWSFYMLSSSIFALYIVTLPNMRPRAALTSAKNLVRKRRLAVILRIVYLPFSILLIMAAIIIPLIILAPAIVAPIFYILSMLAILFGHTYLYCLYRSLLK